MDEKKGMNCYLYVLNTLADWEIGYLTAELKSGRYLRKNTDLKLMTIGRSRNSIKTMGGLRVEPEESIENIDFREGDLLILPGADAWMEEDNKPILNHVPELLNKGVVVAAICGATMALAQIGLLNNRKHTSNDKSILTMYCTGYSGDSLYIDEPVAIDENLITATGLAPLEFAYTIFKKINAMKEETLEAWYQLHRTRESGYFFKLMESLK